MSALRKSSTSTEHIQQFSLGDFKLKSGEVLPDAHIAYTTFGDVSKPAILNPTWYSGVISDTFWLIGEGKALDPNEYFVIVVALFGNGESSSPTNHSIRPFPRISYYDNIKAQHELVTSLGVKHLKAVLGFSMGGQQTYQWAVQYPDMVDLIVPICTSARTSIHNKVFLEGPKAALLAGSMNDASRRAFGRVWAGWGLSQSFYREKVYERLGFKDWEEFLQKNYEEFGILKDPENLLVMLATWQDGDVSAQEPFNGDFEAALRSVKAKALIMPGQTDLYFPAEDSYNELKSLDGNKAVVLPIPSIWGHAAGGQANPEDMKFLDSHIAEFLKDADGLIARVKISKLSVV